MATTPAGMSHESTLGESYVGLPGVIAITLYLALASLLNFYTLIKVWPPDPLPTPVVSTQVNPPGAPQDSTTPLAGPIKWPAEFFWCANDNPKTACWISLNTSLFVIAMLTGALGSLLHSLRSLYWYAGNRRLRWSWAIMYMLLPFSGAVLSTIFYVLIRAGFLPPSATAGPTPTATPFGFAAVGALVGLFSEEAVLKLKQVAETVFAKTPPGKDHAAPPPKVSLISPNSGSVSGGTPVTITGTDFTAGAKVNIGGAPVTAIASVSASSISVTTPAHDAGQADVEVVNPDGQKGALTGGFKFVP